MSSPGKDHQLIFWIVLTFVLLAAQARAGPSLPATSTPLRLRLVNFITKSKDKRISPKCGTAVDSELNIDPNQYLKVCVPAGYLSHLSPQKLDSQQREMVELTLVLHPGIDPSEISLQEALQRGLVLPSTPETPRSRVTDAPSTASSKSKNLNSRIALDGSLLNGNATSQVPGNPAQMVAARHKGEEASALRKVRSTLRLKEDAGVSTLPVIRHWRSGMLSMFGSSPTDSAGQDSSDIKVEASSKILQGVEEKPTLPQLNLSTS
jgi:hypothetical protein